MLLQAVNFTGYRLIRRTLDFTIFFNVIVSDLSKRSLIFKTKT